MASNNPADYIHPIIEAFLRSRALRQQQEADQARLVLQERRDEAAQKNAEEQLKMLKERVELERKGRELLEKKALSDVSQYYRGQALEGKLRPPMLNAGNGPLQTQATSMIIEDPGFGQVGLTGLVTPEDLEFQKRQAYARDTPQIAERAGAVAGAQTQALLPKLRTENQAELDKALAVAAIQARTRLTEQAMENEASKYRADSAFASRVRAANISASKTASTAKSTSLQARFLSQHDSNPLTKRYLVSQEAVTFVNSMSNRDASSADDMGLIYAFAKAMDPESVVREGEYATVKKYAQAWAEKFGFDIKRLFSNSPFLTEQARMQLKATIATKASATEKMYRGYRKTITDRIDKFAGEKIGDDLLGDVMGGGVAPEGPAVEWEEGPDGIPRPKASK